MRRLLWAALALAIPLSAQTDHVYKVAVIGMVHAHIWGHLKTMVAGQSATLVGLAEPNPELTAEAKKMGVPENLIYSDYNKMLDATKPDFVWAFVENNRHLEIVKACAPRGIHIIFEKPLASTYADALQIKKLADRYHVQVMCNYQMAWWPANYTAKAVADSGELGQVYRLRGIVGHGGPGSEGVRNKYFFAWLTEPEKNGAGALMDFGCYNALWSLWYLGRPQTVYAHVNHVRPDIFPKVEDNADIVLGYPKAVGVFEASWDLPRSYQDLEVFGVKGSVYMENGKVTTTKGRQSEAAEIKPLTEENAEPIAYLVSRLRANQPVEGMTALDINLEVNEIIDAAKESVRTGKAVALAQR